MKKIKLDITEFKKRYDVLRRRLLLTICGFTVAAYSLAAASEATYPVKNDYPGVRTEVTDSRAMKLKGSVSEEILKIAENNQMTMWEEAIDEISQWPENWDNEGASPVYPGVGEAAKLILHDTREYMGILDNIFPTSFGSICMEWGKGMNWINAEVTADSFHFYHGNGGLAPSFVMPPSSLDGLNLKKLKSRLALLLREVEG